MAIKYYITPKGTRTWRYGGAKAPEGSKEVSKTSYSSYSGGGGGGTSSSGTKKISFVVNGKPAYAIVPKDAKNIQVKDGKVYYTSSSTSQTVEKYPVYAEGKQVKIGKKPAYLSAGVSSKLKKSIQEGKVIYTTQGIERVEKKQKPTLKQRLKSAKSTLKKVVVTSAVGLPLGITQRKIFTALSPKKTGKVKVKVKKKDVSVTGIEWPAGKKAVKLASATYKGAMGSIVEISELVVPKKILYAAGSPFGYTEYGKAVTFKQAETSYLKGKPISEKIAYMGGGIVGYSWAFAPIGYTEFSGTKFKGVAKLDLKKKEVKQFGEITKPSYLSGEKRVSVIKSYSKQVGKNKYIDVSISVKPRSKLVSRIFKKPRFKEVEAYFSLSKVTPKGKMSIISKGEVILKPTKTGDIIVKNPKIIGKAFSGKAFSKSLFKVTDKGISIPYSKGITKSTSKYALFEFEKYPSYLKAVGGVQGSKIGSGMRFSSDIFMMGKKVTLPIRGGGSLTTVTKSIQAFRFPSITIPKTTTYETMGFGFGLGAMRGATITKPKTIPMETSISPTQVRDIGVAKTKLREEIYSPPNINLNIKTFPMLGTSIIQKGASKTTPSLRITPALELTPAVTELTFQTVTPIQRTRVITPTEFKIPNIPFYTPPPKPPSGRFFMPLIPFGGIPKGGFDVSKYSKITYKKINIPKMLLS